MLSTFNCLNFAVNIKLPFVSKYGFTQKVKYHWFEIKVSF